MTFKCYHYDIARGAYLKPDIFKNALKLAADSGFTHFLPYLENMIRLKGIEKACPVSAYTPEQWREFDFAAKNAGIELIPHFNVIGHSTQVCKFYPELAEEKGGLELDVTLPEVKKWIKVCLDEYCSFSEGKHFLIGGDEWQAPNHNLADSGFKVGKIWAEHLNFAIQILKTNKRIPIVWHDMLLHYPESLEILSRDAVIAFWYYDEDSDYPVINMLQKMGFQTIMASGIDNGLLSGRRRKAINCAVNAVGKYNAYGIMVTSWSDERWEKQCLNIPLCGKLINKEKVPEIFIKTSSLLSLIRGEILENSEYAKPIKAELNSLMLSEVWDKYPLYKKYVLNFLNGDKAQELEFYEERHFTEGPLYAVIKAKNSCLNSDRKNTEDNKTFKLNTFKQSMGKVIKIINEDESFLIYPKYGGTLQAYTKGDIKIIPHSLPAFLENNKFLPGGYRSYSGVGGFRPIWSFGSHHNPCILWQSAFECECRQNENAIIINLSKSMYHVEVQYSIIIKKGISGFTWSCLALNRLDNIYGMFSFNLPISFSEKKQKTTSFAWENKGKLSFEDISDNFFVIPAHKLLKIKMPDITLSIESQPNKTAGFFTDTSSSIITPDLRGYYQKLSKGDSYSTIWKFSINS